MSLLDDRTRSRADDPAFVWRDQATSYAELGALLAAKRRWLGELGVGPGTVVAFTGDHSPHTSALMLALAEERAIMVPLAPGARLAHETYLELAGAELVLAADEQVTRRARSGPAHPLYARLAAEGHGGLVVFSSGSTGKIKAALHDFSRLLERYRRPRPAMRVVTFLLLDHLGGIHTQLHTLANGGTVVAIEDRSPDAVCAAVARHRVELLPTSPTFLNMMLLSEAHRRFDLSSVKLITYGTEVMPAATLARLAQAFPGARLQQTYGLTELGVFQSRSRAPDSLWVKVGGEGVELKVVDDELWIKSHMAMLGYLNAPSPFDAEGWFNTHDRVLVDGEWLRILGRDSDIINVGGEKVYPAEVESVLSEMENVRDATVFGQRNAVVGQVVAARLVLEQPEEPAALRERVRRFCEPRLARYKIPMRVEIAAAADVGERYKKVRPAAP